MLFTSHSCLFASTVERNLDVASINTSITVKLAGRTSPNNGVELVSSGVSIVRVWPTEMIVYEGK